MKLLVLAAAVLLCAPGARAEDDDAGADETQAEAPQPPRAPAPVHRRTPASKTKARPAPPSTQAPAAAPAAAAAADADDDEDGKRHAMSEDEKIEWYCKTHADEGAGCRNHALLLLPYISDYAQYDDVDTRGNAIRKNPCAFSPLPPGCPGSDTSGVSGSLSAAPLTGSSNAGGPSKPILYPTWSSAQSLRDGTYGRYIINFNSYGPGTTFSFGFKPQTRTAMWEWVENVNSTDQCKYEGWISKSPGGAAFGPTPGPCGIDATNAFGGNRGYNAYTDDELKRLPKPPLCPLRIGDQYFFNLKLTWWAPNPNARNVISCIEYLAPMGDPSYFKD